MNAGAELVDLVQHHHAVPRPGLADGLDDVAGQGADIGAAKTPNFGFVANLAAFLQGDPAMTLSWPPYGRWAAGYGTDEAALNWVPKSTIAGKVGYAVTPGGHPELASGFALSVSASSANKDAAYLFIQWLNSRDISIQRVQLPFALRDPFRADHFTSEEYKGRWPEAPQYLAALQEAANTGILDLSILQTDRYEEAMAAFRGPMNTN